MRPDLSRETWTGWGVCIGAVIVAGIAMAYFNDDDGLESQLAAKKSAYLGLGGPLPFADVIQQQKYANQILRHTIDDRKRETGFTVARHFRIELSDIPAGSGITPGYIFKQRYTEVREEIKELAFDRRVDYESSLGFANDVPSDKDAPYMLTMLQLTEKACRIALDKNVKPLTYFSVTHDKAALTGPDKRPDLIEEFPLTLTVQGDLVDVLHILWQFSQVEPHLENDPAPHDYPLVLQGLDITSSNAKPADQIQDVKAVFKIAGMRYLTDDERAKGTSTAFPMELPDDGAAAPTGAPLPPRLGNPGGAPPAAGGPGPSRHNNVGPRP